MASRSKEGLVRFFAHAGALKAQPRRGWVSKLGLEHPESVADHSYRVALMAMVFSDARGLDTASAVRMALLHDLPESVVGDSIPGERSPREKRRLETNAMRRIAGVLPSRLSKEYLEAWTEFEEGRSREAILVRQLDKLEMALQAAEYRRVDPSRSVEEFFASAVGVITDKELAGLLREAANGQAFLEAGDRK